jgi:hypothetical protein
MAGSAAAETDERAAWSEGTDRHAAQKLANASRLAWTEICNKNLYDC